MTTTTQAKLGDSLLRSMIALREQKGEIKIEDVGAILEGIASGIGSESKTDTFIRSEIQNMANYIVQAKLEIAAIARADEEDATRNLNLASMELSEVVKATEEATNNIMDAADEIQNISGGINDSYITEKLGEQAMKIYDACNFQDITGQRINKVLKTLEHLENRIMKLVALFGGDLPEGYVLKGEDGENKRPDEHLMNGPQLTKDAPSQEEIDKLFADM
ncbi:MAG: hypothetical protein CMM94_04875 [Rickettsiales bacterium]|nr:hypothetical protein [Rickettsiales bacterium]|tara:strand:+ start:711 stop:1370 length:660 start_codon:yes stop_codon:yes gene_type:complete